jgi:hypothetical protein
VGQPEKSVLDSSVARLRSLLSQALAGSHPNSFHGLGRDLDGKIELVTRLAYIAGINRSLEIIEDEMEKGARDGNKEAGDTRHTESNS